MSVSIKKNHDIASARERLCLWYMAHKRRLPWRRFTRDHRRSPYATWISEIMLQQTQVKTVVEYYRRWMKEFPNVKRLAAAREDEVFALWAGLGYYTRARNLHRGAREIMRRWNGRFPRTREEWLSLPGVGPYTAGAVLSLAYNLPEPILDGNVIRIFSRFYGIRKSPTDAQSKKIYWERAALWARAPAPQRVNEALMELGALVCLPKTPLCDECPLNAWCYARKHRMQTDLPPMRKYAPVRRVTGLALVIRHGDGVLLKRSGDGDWLKGQWMFPWVEDVQGTEDLTDAEKRKAGKASNTGKKWEAATVIQSSRGLTAVFNKDAGNLLARLNGKQARFIASEKRVAHAITHHRIQLRVAGSTLKGKRPVFKAPFHWLKVEDLPQLLTNSLSRKIWRAGESIKSEN